MNDTLCAKVSVGVDESEHGVHVTVRVGGTVVYSEMHRQRAPSNRDDRIVKCCDGQPARLKECRDCGQWGYYPPSREEAYSLLGDYSKD